MPHMKLNKDISHHSDTSPSNHTHHREEALNHDTTNTPNFGRRQLLQGAGALAASAMLSNGVWAAGSDKPEKEEVKIGFIPLTDCASVVMASVLGFDKKYGIKIIPTKESSWASVRDKLVNGELDAAHVLYGLIYGVQLGIGGPKKDMNILMTLNNNGQAITLSKKLADKGAVDGAGLAKLMAKENATTPSPKLSRLARMRCGCITGWRHTASIL